MNPKTPELLSRIIAIADKTLDRPSGDVRRQNEIETLFDEASQAAIAPTDDAHRYVNDWTLMLVKLLRLLERLGPFGDADEIVRATTIAIMIKPYVQADLAAALQVWPQTSDQNERVRAQWPK